MKSRDQRESALADLNTEVRGWQIDQELFDATVAELAGLNRTDWRCLDILFTRGPMPAGELAEAAHLTTGGVTWVVDRLEAAGLVRRVRDTVDRRRVILEATEQVARQAAPVYGPLVADADAAVQDFDADQLALIAEFVRRTRRVLVDHTARARAMGVEQRQADEPGRARRSGTVPR